MTNLEKLIKDKYGDKREFSFPQVNNLQDIKNLCPKWFAPEAMKFFGTKIINHVYNKNLFITSEDDLYKVNRFYTIRCLIAFSGKEEIYTVGDFCSIKTLAEAKKQIRELLKTI
jgi:hypothetical protein